MKKIYLLLIACCIGFVASAQIIYQPLGTSSFTGGNTYCVGAAIAPLTFDYTTCSSGAGIPTGASCTVNWYYNTTNTTVISGATTLASGPIPMSCATTPIGTLSLTPALSVGGNYYFFCVISWTGGSIICPPGASGSISSPTQLVRISPPPIVPASPVNMCVGSSMTLTDAFGGGTWSSSNAGVISVNSVTGFTTGVTVGGAFITYTLGGCTVTAFVYANDTPTVITPTSGVNICVGGTTMLSNSSAGGTWSSSASATASVGTTGLVSAFAPGTARISYIFTSTGCYTTRVVSVIANPAAIAGSTGICLGGTTTLTDATPGGTWSSSASLTAPVGVGSGIVSGANVGSATITYMLGSGCYTTQTVNVSAPPGVITGPSVVCAGSSITLGNPVTGGVWTTGNVDTATVTGSTGIVTGVGAGTVRISYTIPGCTAVSRLLTVNPLPGTILGIFSTCYGQTTTLTSTGVGGGTWTSSNPTVATADTFTGIIHGHTMGVSTISYIVGSGCATSVSLTVYPLAPIVGSDSVCVASQISVTDIVGGGTWVSSNPAVASIDATTGLVTGLVTGITYIGYSLPTGCSTTFFLRVIPSLPAIAGPLMICNNSTVTLSNGVMGGRWHTSNQYVAGIDSVTGKVSGHFPDTAVISYTIYGCVTTAIATINPLPTPTLTFIASINSLSTAAIYASYQWYDSTTGVIPGATNNTYALPATPGKLAVMVTDFNGCSSRTKWYKNAVGVSDITPESFRIFPNPAVSVVFIDAPVKVKAVVSSTDGKALLNVEDAKEISIRELATGMYFISLYADNGQLLTVQKFIKQ